MPDAVLSRNEGPVRVITLNRPEKLNALNREMVEALSVHLAEAAADDATRVVVLGGEGRSFCSGYDLTEEADPTRSPAESLEHSLDRMLEIFDHPKPVIAQVHGHCLAGGCDLMMMCDLAVASEDAVFGQPEIRFGSAVVAYVMPWLIGARRAKELLFTGEDRLTAEEAMQIGLVNRVVPRERLEEETMALAVSLSVVDPGAMQLTKRAVNQAWERAGFREALTAGVELGGMIESERVPGTRGVRANRRRAGSSRGGPLAGREVCQVRHYVLTLSCPDRPGIVNAITGALLQVDANILESAQFGDVETNTFALRTVFETRHVDAGQVEEPLREVAERLAGRLKLRPVDVRPRVLVMVSKFDHCLLDLLHRQQYGELAIEIPLIVSNHPDCAELAARYDVPFVHIPVTAETKAEAEAEAVAVGGGERDRLRCPRPVHADPLRRDLPGARRACHQHPPLLPARFQGLTALPPGASARGQADRGHRPFRDRRPR